MGHLRNFTDYLSVLLLKYEKRAAFLFPLFTQCNVENQKNLQFSTEEIVIFNILWCGKGRGGGEVGQVKFIRVWGVPNNTKSANFSQHFFCPRL